MKAQQIPVHIRQLHDISLRPRIRRDRFEGRQGIEQKMRAQLLLQREKLSLQLILLEIFVLQPRLLKLQIDLLMVYDKIGKTANHRRPENDETPDILRP